MLNSFSLGTLAVLCTKGELRSHSRRNNDQSFRNVQCSEQDALDFSGDERLRSEFTEASTHQYFIHFKGLWGNEALSQTAYFYTILFNLTKPLALLLTRVCLLQTQTVIHKRWPGQHGAYTLETFKLLRSNLNSHLSPFCPRITSSGFKPGYRLFQFFSDCSS